MWAQGAHSQSWLVWGKQSTWGLKAGEWEIRAGEARGELGLPGQAGGQRPAPPPAEEPLSKPAPGRRQKKTVHMAHSETEVRAASLCRTQHSLESCSQFLLVSVLCVVFSPQWCSGHWSSGYKEYGWFLGLCQSFPGTLAGPHHGSQVVWLVDTRGCPVPELRHLGKGLRVDLDIFLDTKTHSKSNPTGNQRNICKNTQVDRCMMPSASLERTEAHNIDVR